MNTKTLSSRCKLFFLVFMACAFCLTSACSALKFSYNNAPDLLYWWLDGYVDFSAKQKILIKQELSQLQQWHRQNELPKYTEIVQHVSSVMQNDIKPQQVCEVFDTAKIRIEQLNLQITPIVQTISHDLSAKQLAHISNKFADQNEKWQDKWMDPNLEKREKKRLQDVVDRAESFYGPLNQEQKDLLLASIRTSSFKPEISYQRRLKNQQKLLSILRSVQQGDQTNTQANLEIQNFMHQMTEPDDREYSIYINQLTLESCQTIASLHNTTTPKQRKTLQENLKGYLNDLHILIELEHS